MSAKVDVLETNGSALQIKVTNDHMWQLQMAIYPKIEWQDPNVTNISSKGSI